MLENNSANQFSPSYPGNYEVFCLYQVPDTRVEADFNFSLGDFFRITQKQLTTIILWMRRSHDSKLSEV